MRRIVVYRTPEDTAPSLRSSFSSTLMGLAVAGGLALLVHQIWQAGQEAPWVPGQPLPRKPATPTIARAQQVLATDEILAEHHLDLLPGGRGSIELHGWVDSRSQRARAARLVREAIHPVELVNSILVHGEDDSAQGDEFSDEIGFDAEAASA